MPGHRAAHRACPNGRFDAMKWVPITAGWYHHRPAYPDPPDAITGRAPGGTDPGENHEPGETYKTRPCGRGRNQRTFKVTPGNVRFPPQRCYEAASFGLKASLRFRRITFQIRTRRSGGAGGAPDHREPVLAHGLAVAQADAGSRRPFFTLCESALVDAGRPCVRLSGDWRRARTRPRRRYVKPSAINRNACVPAAFRRLLHHTLTSIRQSCRTGKAPRRGASTGG